MVLEYSFKFLLLGSEGSGKTSFINYSPDDQSNIFDYSDCMGAKLAHNSNYWLEFGKCYARSGFKNRDMECFERACELEDDNPDLYDDIAWEFYSNSMVFDRDKVVEFCDKALKLDPKRVRSWYVKAEALKLLQKNPIAIKTFKKVLEINPKVAYVWHSMDMVYQAMGNYLSAMGCFVKAAEIASNKKIAR